MNYQELMEVLDQMKNDGSVQGQNVEVIINNKKHFIENVIFKSDSLQIFTTRKNYFQIFASDLLGRMKEYDNLVEKGAECRVFIDGEYGDNRILSNIFVSKQYVELVV